jgi:HlyD family secretion protein
MVSEEALLRDKAAYERAQAALSAAQADVRVAQASLRMDEADLARACICSPIDWVVLERSVEPGQIVAASFQAPVLFTLAEDLAQMELRVDIDEADIGRVKPGDSASFSVEAYQDMSFPAEISELRYAPRTVDGVVTYEAILSVDNSRLLLRPGMTATAEITVDEVSDVLAIPNAALRFTPPVADSGDAGEDQRSGLLGMIFRPPSRSPATVPQAEAGPDGRRTVWLLRAGVAEPVDILPGVSDGLVTEVREAAVTVGDPVITDMADER